MFSEKDRQWLFLQMQDAGVDTGSYDDFKKSLNNQEDRDWYYRKSLDLGLDVGSDKDFYDMMVEEQAPASNVPAVNTESKTVAKPQATGQKQGVFGRLRDIVANGVQSVMPKKTVKQPTGVPSFHGVSDLAKGVNRKLEQPERPLPALDPNFKPSLNVPTTRQVMEGLGLKTKTPKMPALNVVGDEAATMTQQTRQEKAFDLGKDVRERGEEAMKQGIENAVGDRETQLDRMIGDIERQIKDYDKTASPITSQYMKQASGDYTAYKDDPRKKELVMVLRDLQEARTQLRRRKQLHESSDELGGIGHPFTAQGRADWLNNWKNFGYAVWDTMSDVNYYTSGLPNVDKAIVYRRMKNKLESGEELSPFETELATAGVLRAAIEQESDLPNGYWAGQTTAEMVPFMIQMAINPGGGIGKGVAQTMLRTFGREGFKAVAARYTGRVLGNALESAILTNTVQAPATLMNAVERNRGELVQRPDGSFAFEGGDNPLVAGYKAEAASIIENFTELGMGGKLSSWLEKSLKKVGGTKAGQKMGLGYVNDMVQKIGSTDFHKGFRKFADKTHWNGLIEEPMEEEESIIFNSFLTGDNKISDLWDKEVQAKIFAGTMWFGGFMSGMNTAAYPFAKQRMAKRLDEADTYGVATFGKDEWGVHKSAIDGMDEKELPKFLYSLKDDDSFSNEQKAALFDYASRLKQWQGANVADMLVRMEGNLSKDESLVHGAYERGRELGTEEGLQGDAANEAKRMLDYERERIGEIATDDMITALDVDPVGTLDFIQKSEDWTAEEKQAAMDYVNAKVTYDGMIGQVRDDIDSRVKANDAVIDSRVNRNDGMIHPATMKDSDAPAYIVSGNVVMTDDGTSVDREKSDKDIIVMNTETGKVEFQSIDDVMSVDEALNPDELKAESDAAIREEYAQKASESIEGVLPFNVGDTYEVLDNYGSQHTVSVVPVPADMVLDEREVLVSIDGEEPVALNKEYVQSAADNMKNAELLQKLEAQSLAELEQIEQDEEGAPAYRLNDGVTLRTEDGLVNGTIVGEEDADGNITVQVDKPVNGASVFTISRESLDGMNDGLLKKQEEEENAATMSQQSGQEEEVKSEDDVMVERLLGRDEKSAGRFIKNNVDELEKQLTAARKKESKATDLDTFEKETAEYDAEVQRLEAELERWRNISNRVRDTRISTVKEAADDAIAQKKVEELGEPLTLREWIMRSLYNRGYKMVWGDDPKSATRGLASHLGVKGSQKETKDRLWMMDKRDKGALYPEEVAEQMLRGYADDMGWTGTDGDWNVNSQDVLNELLDVVRSYGKRSDLGNAIVAEHEKVSNESMRQQREEEEYLKENFARDMGFTSYNEYESAVGYAESDQQVLDDADLNELQNQIAEEYEQRANQTGDTSGSVVVSATGQAGSEGNTAGEAGQGINAEVGSQGTGVVSQGEGAGQGVVAPSEQLKPTDLRDGVKPDTAELGADEAKAKAKGGFLDAIRALYSKGKEYASQLYQRTFFDVAKTPDFMKKLGLTGDKFTIRYGVLSRHMGKDAEHALPVEVWEQLPDALQDPFAITRYYEDEEKKNQKGYRLYTAIRLPNGSYVVVGAEVKNSGRDLEVNAIDTVFGRDTGVGSKEDLIYTSTKITPEQQALLDGHNPHQYPAEREQGGEDNTLDNTTDTGKTSERGKRNDTATPQSTVSEGKGTEVSDNKQENQQEISENVQGIEGYSAAEVLNAIRGDVEIALDEAGLDDVVIKDMAIIGSRMRGDAEEDSDLDVLLEYEGDISEDGLFNILNDTPIEIEGIKVDINPITKGKSGTIAEFLKRNAGYKKTSTPEQIEAEEQSVNTNPTEGQKKAGNYKMGHIKVDGFDVTIENPKGSVRRGTDASGKKWEQKMNNTYGYIRGTEGVDGDHIDVFLSDDPTQGDVFVVDQVNKDGSFDEHKVMYGFPDVESARQAYLSNYEEGWQGLGAITHVSKEEFKKWVDSSHRKTKPFAEYSSVKTLGDVQVGEGSNETAGEELETAIPNAKTSIENKQKKRVTANSANKIDDFGEKIGGARKDVARDRIRSAKGMTQKDLKSLKKGADDILSIANILRLYNNGQMDEETARGFIAFNNAVKASKGYRFADIALKKYRDAAVAWEEGNPYAFELTDADVKEYMEATGMTNESKARHDIEYILKEPYDAYLETYKALNYPSEDRKVGRYVIADHSKSKFTVAYGSRKYWVKNGYRASSGYPFSTMESAIEKMKALCPVVETKDKKQKGEKAEHGLHIVKGDWGFYIKSRNIPGKIYLSKRFWNEKEAKQYLEDNLEALKERESKMVDALMGSNIGMAEREGVDYRNGRDVTPNDFLNEFGFRGVEFGNWVPQAERQMYLNKTYDAIKDFCAIVGISPKAFSLGGRLGLAFGARGKSRAMAHYEPVREVINLTRMSGVGSLAHEWFHALDNYLAKQKSGNISDMATETHDTVREELADVFKDMYRAMKELDYHKRSMRAGDYWGSTVEEFARLFENYIYNELRAREAKSPVLVRQDVLYDNIDGDERNSWPYPSVAENAEMKPWFDRLFDTIQEKTDKNGKVVLFQKAGEDVMPVTENEAALRDALVELLRDAGIDVSMDADEGQKVLDEYGELVRMAQKNQHQKPRKLTSQEEEETYTTDISDANAGAKVVKNLEELAKKYEEKSNKPRTFLKDVAKAVGATAHKSEEGDSKTKNGNKSKYVTIKAKNGYIFTLRLANHNATVRNFDNNDEKEGVSIVVSGTVNNGVNDNGKAHVFEYFYPEQDLRKAEGKPLVDIIRSIEQMMYSGKYTDKTGIAKEQEVNIKYFRTPNGEAYGFTKDGKIYLDPRIATAETPIHEYGHLWCKWLRKANPQAWERLKETLMGEKGLYDYVKSLYPDLKGDELMEEVFVHFSGKRGAERMKQEQERLLNENKDGVFGAAKIYAMFAKLRDILKKFWDEARSIFAGKVEGLKEKTAEDFADMMMSDLLNGFKPNDEINEEENDIRFSLDDSEPFYSNAEKAVTDIKQEKATPEQWLKMIEKNGGLKAGEDKWLGLSDWLKGSDKKTMTKDEVLDYIRKNEIRLWDVNYSTGADWETSPKMIELRDEFDQIAEEKKQEMEDLDILSAAFDEEMAEKYGYGWKDKLEGEDKKRDAEFEKRWKNLGSDPYRAAFREMVNRHGDDFEQAFEADGGILNPVFDYYEDDLSEAARYYLDMDENPINETRLNYTTEGLDNKKEIALVVPNIEPWNVNDEIHFGDAGGGRAIAWVRFGDTTTNAKGGVSSTAIMDELEKKYDNVDDYSKMTDEDAAKRAFANYLVRDNADVDMMKQWLAEDVGEDRAENVVSLFDKLVNDNKKGQRVLVIDEIQSKRHQEGRERGYYENGSYEKSLEEFQTYNRRMREKYGEHSIPSRWSEEERKEFERLRDENNRLYDAQRKGIPSAPFDKNWHELAMKRMLRYAAENGYDKVAWTKGEQQSERYDIGKKIKKITVSPKEDGTKRISLDFGNDEGYGDFYQMTVGDDGKIISGDFDGRSLSDVVGKELAVKMLGIKERQVLTGENLRIGGEGMKGFYDQMLPRFMDKYGKKWGVKTGEVELPNIGDQTYRMNSDGKMQRGLKMWSVDVTPEMKESVMQGQPMFREVEERERIDWLESQPKVTVYRSMVMKDGKLYPPMSSKEAEGKSLRQPSEIGKWEESEEAPEKAVLRNGKWVFPLRKDNGKMLYAAYNPYLHTSRTMLNDQFSEAQDRENLVVVEMEVPVSELTSGYQAEKAKDSVGAKQWKAGVIQGQLNGTREVILTRWAKPVRVVPVDEVADNIMKQLDGQVDVMPTNVVTPKLRKALEKKGMKFVETDNRGKIKKGEYAGKTWASVYGKNGKEDLLREAGIEVKEKPQYVSKRRYTKKQQEAAIRRATERFYGLVDKMGLSDKVTVFATGDDYLATLKRKPTEQNMRKARSKGWYDPITNKIFIIANNNDSYTDTVKTLLHEGVAHFGLREMVGKERFNQFLDDVYAAADEEIRRQIVALARDKYDWDFRKATEEFMAQTAEEMDFENTDNPETFRNTLQAWWRKIKDLFLQMMGNLGFGEYYGDEIGINEIKYLLWRSWKNMTEPGKYKNPWDVFAEAEDVVMQNKLKVGRYEEVSEQERNVAENVEEPATTGFENETMNEWLAFEKRVPKMSDEELLGYIEAQDADNPYHSSVFDEYDERHRDEYLRRMDFYKEELDNLFESYRDPDEALYHIDGEMRDSVEDRWYSGGYGTEDRTALMAQLDAINEWLNEYYYKQDAEENGMVRESDKALFRDGDEKAIARYTYEHMVTSAANQFTEAVQDSMLSLKNLYMAILDAEGDKVSIEEVKGYENAYLAENRMHSASEAQVKAWHNAFMKPLIAEMYKLTNNDPVERRMLADYMMAKHGLERNEVMAERDFKRYQEETPNGTKTFSSFRSRDYAGLTALTGENRVVDAEGMAAQMVEEYERTHDTTELWKRVNAATKSSLEKTYRSGMLDRERYEQIRDMFKYYIPLQGFDEKVASDLYAYFGNDGTRSYGTPIRGARGRKSLADDPIATIEMNGEAAIRQGNRNLMKQNFLNFVLNHPSDLVSVSDVWLRYNDATDEWEQYFDADLREDDSPDEIERKMREFEERMEQLAENDPDHYRRGTEYPNIPYRVLDKNQRQQHQVLVRRNGKDYVLTINGNPRAAQALNGLTNPDVFTEGVFGKAMNIGQQLNRQLSLLYTTRNPEFVLSNYLRDAIYSNHMVWVKESPQYAIRFHKNFGLMNPVFLGKMFTEWESGELAQKVAATPTTGKLSEMDRLRKMFLEFMENGGETGWTNLRDIEKHKRDLEKELMQEGSTSRKAWKALMGCFDLMNRAVENNARFAAYVTSREMGRSVERSIWDAKEISVNFNKKGSGDKFLTATGQTRLGKLGSVLGGLGRGLYVFWNASTQGLNNIAKASKRHPFKAASVILAGQFMMGVLMPLVSDMLCNMVDGGDGDDDDNKDSYYNLPEYIRRSNICFRWTREMPWITIPLPIEFRAVYGLGELATGTLTGKERYTGEEFAKQFVSQLSQVLPLDFMEGGGGWHAFVPSSVKPMVEAMDNKSWSGLPIYRDNKYTPYKPQWTRAYASANQYIVEATKWLNDVTGGDEVAQGWIDWNPAAIEYMLEGYLGGLFTVYDRLQKTAQIMFGDREFDWRDVLFASRVLKHGDERTQARKVKNEYFDLKEEYEKTKSRLNGYKKIADSGREDALAYAERIDFLHNSKEYLHYEIMDYYTRILDAYSKLGKDAEGEEKKRIEAEENAVRDECVELIHAIDAGKDIDVDAAIESMLERMLDSEDEKISRAAENGLKRFDKRDVEEEEE